ncbi:diguanylate cyclase [Svornostia abyssi]|uniref:Diguanylate cyclase n=1 Tax=Svornostia abyssi TaxID=2898438 RepID=A0ABY5PJQ4_9ACTN|nr:diguanylate cyclase [Parviterribacteraceae bacterium J379]
MTHRALLALGFAGVAVHGVLAVVAPNAAGSGVLYICVAALAFSLVLARGIRVADERAVWLVLAASQGLWLLGDLSWEVLGDPAFFSVSDGIYVLSYVAQFAGIGLLMRARLRLLPGARWLDGLVVGTTAAAIVAAVLVEPIRRAAGDEIVEALFYPTLDLAVIVLIAVPIGMTAWRPGRTLGWLAGGVTLIAVTDVLYAGQTIDNTYVEGSLLATLWLLAYTAIATAAWQPVERRTFDADPRWREGIVPGVCGFVAIGVLAAAGVLDLGNGTVLLAAVAGSLSGLRAAVVFRAHMRLLHRSRAEARQDQLTGLPNRRALIDDLEGVVADGAPVTLAFFDLDGFKLYNDSFGHAAGDALLQRLGGRLTGAVGDAGRGYRLGGDEFCVLLDGDGAAVSDVLDACGQALREHGDVFAITASAGSVAIPAEAREAGDALRIADQRMYARKAERRGPARMQARDLLLAVVRETEPDLDEHNGDVGRLARQLGDHLGLEGDDLDIVVRAAELHDVGKVAVPDEILHKPGPLTEDEWQLMRQHTIIGERILAASPGMAPVAELVRASHERWDGGGYPDGLRGEEIPLGARIITVCDSFDAIVSDRPYAVGRSIREAVEELERCAGGQFDPQVVGAFAELVRSGALGLGVQHA